MVHNGDWSGDVIVWWEEAPLVGGKPDFPREATLPASLLLALGREAASHEIRDRLIAFLENMQPDKKA